jgi:mRNA-decapping enzyme subunit 2
MKAFEEFLQYKTRVPVRGAILLNEAMDSTVLVKGWKKGANWSFPRGKINKDEDDLDCAIREVNEETGFDIREAGLVPKADDVKYIEISMREQQIRLYVFRDVPMDTIFQPKTRKEISKIQWYKLSELPAFRKKGNHQHDDAAAASNANKFYMVAPFLVPLKKWVIQQKKKDAARAANHSHLSIQYGREDPLTEDDLGNQTETAGVNPTGYGPGLDTLEGATRELQRLLKVQPPTQGLQLGPSGPSISNRDNGEALMAILQSKKAEPAPLPAQPHSGMTLQNNNQLPHTPFGLTYNTAPEPHTPHHHHPTQLLPQNNYQPPPNFPMAPQMNQNLAGAFFNQMPGSVQQNVSYTQDLRYMVTGQPRQHEPVLRHPQPLPPQVQQSLLTRHIHPTPNLPDGAMHANIDAPYSAQNAQAAPPLPYAQQGNNMAAPRKMTTHTLSLLSAFKTETTRAPEPKQVNPPTVSQGQSSMPVQGQSSIPTSQPNQYQPGPWSNVQGQQASGSTSMPRAMQSLQSSLDGAIAQAALLSSAKSRQPADKHRSALLDMFKKEIPPSGSQVTAKPVQVNPETIAHASIGETSRGSKMKTTAEAVETASRANGGPVVMNPELNLPYRALQILSRPKQAENMPAADRKDVQPMTTSQRPGPVSRTSSGTKATSSEPTNLTRLPPFSQPAAVTQPQSHPQYQAFSGPNNAAGFPATDMLHNRQESNPEQKQKLLSLFGKPQPSPNTEDRGKEKEIMQQAHSGSPTKSRVSSFASAGGREPGSAGSKQQISSADRDFLLGFLQSVSNKSH